MNTFVETAKFSTVYLKRYWFRFVTGIALAFLFGISNGLFLGGVYTMLNRLDDPAANAQKAADDYHSSLDQLVKQGVLTRADANNAEAKYKADATLKTQHDQAAKAAKAAKGGAFSQSMKAFGNRIKTGWNSLIDPILPLKGRPLDWEQALGGLLFLPLIAALRGFLGYGSSYLLAWSGQRITNDVKGDAFRKVSSLSLDYFHKTTTGELLSRIENDSVGLNTFLRLGLSDLIKEPVTILSLLVVMVSIDWKFTLLSLFFLPACIIPTRRLSKKLKELGRGDFTTAYGQGNITMESFQNIRITKAYSLEKVHAEIFDRIGRRSSGYMMKSVQGREMLNPVVQTLSALGIGAVLLYAVWSGASFAKLQSFLFALIAFYTPFKKLNGIGVYLTQLGLSLERLMGLFKLQPSVKEDPNPVALPAFRHGIDFEHVSFSYGDGKVLNDVSFSLTHGQRLGLAGESGSGKSSLLNLLFRFYDATEGVIQIDGLPIQRYRFADLRQQMALVSQDILLFNATVAENIAYGKIGASRAEIEDAARRAHAADFIAALPEGYDTPLGERGVRLSGGQRQRIAIARAFVRNSPILVLDEATASLDSKSEAEVQGAIDELTENRTVICVAHRLSTLRSMDMILVMEHGRVVERGSFDELLSRNGSFAAMAARQSIFSQAA